MDTPDYYKKWDLFISYASEDKEDVARPLANLLDSLGYRVWFDDFILEVGDSLNEKINEGLRMSTYGVVILSPSFMSKKWPRNELNALVALERDSKRILPVWHKVTVEDVERFNPVIADRCAFTTNQPLDKMALALSKKIGGIQFQSNLKGMDGMWQGISGRLRTQILSDSFIVGEYDWFGERWSGQLQGNFEERLFRFAWDWNVDNSAGEGFFFHVAYDSQLRMPGATLYGLVGGWVYQRDISQLPFAIEQYREYFQKREYKCDFEMHDMSKVAALTRWEFASDSYFYQKYKRKWRAGSSPTSTSNPA